MSSNITTLEAFSDRQVLPDGDGHELRATLSGKPVRLRRIADLEAAAESIAQRQTVLAALSHPAIVLDEGVATSDQGVYAWRTDGDERPIANTNLADRLALAQRLCEALGQIHRLGTGHGGLDQVSQTNDGELRLVDPGYRDDESPEKDMQALGQLLFRWETQQSAEPLDDHQRAAALAQQSAARPLPPRLSTLILKLLASQSNHQAGGTLSAFETAEELEDVRLALIRADAQVLAHWQTEPVTPVVSSAPPAATEPSPAVGAASRRDNASPSRWPMLLAGTAAAALVLGIVYVVRVLPERMTPVDEPEPVAAIVAAPEPVPVASQPAPLSQADLERMLRQREAAQAILDELINLQLELEDQQVERWAERSFNAAAELAAQGDEPFRAQAFERALELYTKAFGQMREVAALRPIVVAEALERGTLALRQGQGDAADDAFSLALAIDPENALAASGKARAQTLDQVRTLMSQASTALGDQDLGLAKTLLEQVMGLDPLTDGAQSLLVDVNAQLADAAFRAAMSEGLNALGSGRFSDARNALNRALAMRPSSQAPRDALLEVSRRERDSLVTRDSALAQNAVEQERWEAAIKHFNDMLRRDPNVRQAQEGLSRAEARLDLEARLLAMLTDPSTLWSDKGRAESRSLLYDARAVDNVGPRLADQLTRLTRQIDLAGQPRQVIIESDSACNVVVYKVARLGQFDQRQLELLPGPYTAVGTRDGYRDVRVEFMVPAGQQIPPVELRCEEQVLARG